MASNWQVIASVAICFVPVIGPAYMLASAVAGQDLITGTKLSGPERFLCALGGLALAAKAASTLAKAAGPMFKALGRFSSGLSKLFSGVKDGQLAAKVSEVTSAARASMGEGIFARALSGVGNTARELRSAVVNGGRRLLSLGRDYTRAELRQITSEEAQKVANRGLGWIDSMLTAAQRRAIKDKPWLIWKYRGSIVHEQTFLGLQSRLGEDFVRYARRGIDFSFGNGLQIELTTVGSAAAHARAPRSIPRDWIATYTWVE